MSDIATVTVRRKARFRDLFTFGPMMFVPMEVLMDGRKLGNVDRGKMESFSASPGAHTVQVKLWPALWSESVGIDLSANSSIKLECGASSRYWKGYLLFLGIYFFIAV